ncbi:MAG: CDP-diacylglycerol--glycerol-3-phosphate 3-phosphatidyltransferase [Bacteriovoracia bacterium]
MSDNEKNTENPSEQEFYVDNLPNRLTIFRVALIPLVVVPLLFQGMEYPWLKDWYTDLGWIAAWVFALASITDFFDGYIARKKGITTIFGSFLDPIADKFLVVSSLIMLQDLGRIPSIIVIILILREMYMTSLRLLAINEGLKVPVNQLGKWKTTTQMIGIPLLMVNHTWHNIPFGILGTIAIYIASFLSLYSAFNYSWGLVKGLKEKKKEKLIEKEIS